MWYNTKATEMLGIDYPIMLGPFGGGLSTVELVATVSNAGGLGGYGAYTLNPDEIIEADRQIKEATGKPYNINLWVSDTDAVDGTVTTAQYEEVKKLFKPYFDEVGIPLLGMPVPFKSRFENQVEVILHAGRRFLALCLVCRRLIFWNNAVSWVSLLLGQPPRWMKPSSLKMPVSI